MRRYSFKIFADYNQVLLHDSASEGDLSDLWNDEACDKKLAASIDAISFSTVRNMDVPVEIIIGDRKPKELFSDWDHIVKSGIELGSGSLVVRGVSDYLPNASTIEVVSGRYAVWVLYGDIKAVSEDGLGGSDYYKVIMLRS